MKQQQESMLLTFKILTASVILVLSGSSFAAQLSIEEAAQIRANSLVINGEDDNLRLPAGGCVTPCLHSTMAGANTSGAPSQQFTNSGIESDFFLTDEFSLPSVDPAFRGWLVDSIDFLGYYTAVSAGLADPASVHSGVNMTLVPDNTGAPEDGGASIRPQDNVFVDRNGLPANIVNQAINDLGDGDYSVSFPTAVFLEPGDTYWVSVQSIGPFDDGVNPGSQWFWNQSADGEGSQGYFLEDDLGIGPVTTCNAAWDNMQNCSFTFAPGSTVGSGHAQYPNLSFQVNGQALMVGGVATVTGGGSALSVSEAGTTDSFDFVLTAPPLAGATVSVSVASSDTTEALASPASLVFDDSNWNVPQTVTVQGQFDTLADGDVNFQIFLGPAVVSGSADAQYDGLTFAPIDGVNLNVVNALLLPVPAMTPYGLLLLMALVGLITWRKYTRV